MSRYLGKGTFGYSQRTGRKTRSSDLVEDGHVKGLIVEREDADREHPQKRGKAVAADRLFVRRPMPENKSDPVTIRIGYETGDDLGAGRLVLPTLSFVKGAVLVTFDGGSIVA